MTYSIRRLEDDTDITAMTGDAVIIPQEVNSSMSLFNPTADAVEYDVEEADGSVATYNASAPSAEPVLDAKTQKRRARQQDRMERRLLARLNQQIVSVAKRERVKGKNRKKAKAAAASRKRNR